MPTMTFIIKHRVGYEGKYALIVPDHGSGRRNRYTVYLVPATPARRTRIIGRELPLGLAKELAETGTIAKKWFYGGKWHKLPAPGGFVGSIPDRCPHCSFQPTSRSDFCDYHRRRGFA